MHRGKGEGGGGGKKAATPTNSRQQDMMASSSNRQIGLQIGSAWFQRKINLRPQHRGVHLVTEEILRQIPELSCFSVGLCHIQSNYYRFISHSYHLIWERKGFTENTRKGTKVEWMNDSYTMIAFVKLMGLTFDTGFIVPLFIFMSPSFCCPAARSTNKYWIAQSQRLRLRCTCSSVNKQRRKMLFELFAVVGKQE